MSPARHIENPPITAGILFADRGMGASMARFLHFVLRYRCVDLSSFFDIYKRKEAVEQADSVDLVVAESLQDGMPVGFQFAKWVGKRSLLVFYQDQLKIENEGPLWLVLPGKADRLSRKIEKLAAAPVPGEDAFENMERRFPVLEDSPEHRWYMEKPLKKQVEWE